MTESDPGPSPVRVVQRIVASCFYSELAVGGAPVSVSGPERFAHWTRVFAPSGAGYEEPEIVRAREDLALCGEARFSEDWEFLVQLVRAQGFSPVFGALEGILAPKVAEGYERRRRRTGVA